MQNIKRTTFAVAGIAAAAMLSLTACGGSSASSAPASSAPSSAPAESSMASPSTSASAAAMDPAANLVGSGCAAYAEQVPDGAGSVAGSALARNRPRARGQRAAHRSAAEGARLSRAVPLRARRRAHRPKRG